MMTSKALERWSPLLLLVLILALWQAVVWLFKVPDYIFPGPIEIALQFSEFKLPLLPECK
jgi:NitT/TauT family transport system permease protein